MGSRIGVVGTLQGREGSVRSVEPLQEEAGRDSKGVEERLGGGIGDLGGVEEAGGVGSGDGIEEDAVGDAGDEVADVFYVGEGGHGAAEGLFGLVLGGIAAGAAVFGGSPGEFVGATAVVDGGVAGGGRRRGIGD